MISLAPATPAEATFEEVSIVDVATLIPVLPFTATFDDMPVTIPSISDLSPETTAVAEFEDAVDGDQKS